MGKTINRKNTGENNIYRKDLKKAEKKPCLSIINNHDYCLIHFKYIQNNGHIHQKQFVSLSFIRTMFTISHNPKHSTPCFISLHIFFFVSLVSPLDRYITSTFFFFVFVVLRFDCRSIVWRNFTPETKKGSQVILIYVIQI